MKLRECFFVVSEVTNALVYLHHKGFAIDGEINADSLLVYTNKKVKTIYNVFKTVKFYYFLQLMKNIIKKQQTLTRPVQMFLNSGFKRSSSGLFIHFNCFFCYFFFVEVCHVEQSYIILVLSLDFRFCFTKDWSSCLYTQNEELFGPIPTVRL